MNELHVALEAARAAAVLLREAYERPLVHVEHKGTVDLVTEVDLACERRIREVLARHTPSVPVLGEEEGGAPEASVRWVIDPLDGTTNFVHRLPWFCVSVALEVDGESVVGAIIDPLSGREWAAARGGGATLNGQKIHVSPCREISQALVATGFPYDRQQRAAEYLAPVERVMQRAQGIRRAGSAALDLAMVACGRIDAFWESHLQRWDVAAGRVLVTEAGGRVSGHGGQALDGRDPCPLATNAHLHNAMMELLASQ